MVIGSNRSTIKYSKGIVIRIVIQTGIKILAKRFFMKSQGYTISEFVQELMVPGHIDHRVIQDIGDFVNCYSK